jgi:hypothetical protein
MRDEMGRASSTHRGDETCVHSFSQKTSRKEDLLGYLHIHGRIILKLILKNMVWARLIWLRIRSVLRKIMNFQVK